MIEVILHQPEIPPNTGNIIRLCANSGTRLHLIKPLGFALDDKQLKRAGLDYHEQTCLAVHDNLAACLNKMGSRRIFAVTTKASLPYSKVVYGRDDVFLFGSESRGLPVEVLQGFVATRKIRIPMLPASRSLNLSNAVAIIVYEAWRQTGFSNDDGGGV
ncbi:tRNA (cytidine(34)-2'-O)-methyltransferase [Nitrosomonas mobilis]|uniref:tRNA (cytidine(34)-2'-O)-methyltransferase n=1 Tax=Nitrosomonas mobilis TaxID=51642 RepID=A0A1G5SE03_9PROT|nr:tRNA (cytidine(34)-2'-O)-methyltransferase [Nitrosomonas mobilis]SCZ85415.1 putative rRNA methylase [Nitrosomonas mobilis]HNO74341.1 tRNA (cytidine(34)-2'-O)-methyltransferase [Nitrosomonas mobilis]